jgi:hypothetical protein
LKKLESRALLWDNVELTIPVEGFPSQFKVMDRIYSVFDSDIVTFKRWADENGYVHKLEQNAKSHQYFQSKDQVHRLRCGVSIPEKSFTYYPYLDTFPFFDIHAGFLYNDEYNSNWDYRLVQAEWKFNTIRATRRRVDY